MLTKPSVFSFPTGLQFQTSVVDFHATIFHEHQARKLGMAASDIIVPSVADIFGALYDVAPCMRVGLSTGLPV